MRPPTLRMGVAGEGFGVGANFCDLPVNRLGGVVQQVAKDMVAQAKNNKETGQGGAPQKKGEVIASPQDLALSRRDP
ncbi:MAG: hypothetical protein WCQ89_22025 [Verrucomicrobiota bacterium]